MSAFQAIPDVPTTTPASRLLHVLEKLGIGDPQVPDGEKAQNLVGLFTPGEIQEVVDRARVREAISRRIEQEGRLKMAEVARVCRVSRELVGRVWLAMCDEYPSAQPPTGSLTIGIPKETRARDMVVDILAAGGFRLQGASVVDIRNGLDPIGVNNGFRQMDLLTVAKEGLVNAVIMGSDKTNEILARQKAKGSAVLGLERWGRYRANVFRLCFAVPASVAQEDSFNLVNVLQGGRIATSYPHTAGRLLWGWNLTASEILRMGGNVETAPAQLGATAILDIIQTGGSLRQNGLVSVLEIPCGMDLLTLRGARMSNSQRTLLQSFATRLQEGERLAAG